MMQTPVRAARVRKVHGATTSEEAEDVLAVEEPLEIRVSYHEGGDDRGARIERPISITMRTPGDDRDLAVGYLCTEGIVSRADDVVGVSQEGDIVTVSLRSGRHVDAVRLERHSVTSSSCGVCGKTSLDAVHVPASRPLGAGPVLAARVFHSLPGALRSAQSVFDKTGGIHAAALFDAEGARRVLREDVGRHNAVDKLVGAMLFEEGLPLGRYALMVSGRASFELVQKARVAGIPILAAVGAPSSLAIDLARREGMTVLGFVRDDRFNVYCGEERVSGFLR